ncbi:MAG TPA: gas vesicle protein GvpG [Gaiellaceae bacterium]|jgi:cytosine/adenosine deaminase-related metal-dependent hydrolase|nr:gas vesicle protein GvpG [Gaiellaceae bacterium]
MGLLTGLLTLPLAPLRGTIWLAEQLAAEAEREMDEEAAVRRALAEAERQFETGVLSLVDYERIEDELLERLERARAAKEAT